MLDGNERSGGQNGNDTHYDTQDCLNYRTPSKWIKQHLRIKTFYGVSENAVKSQIWIAVSVYLLVAILKKELGLSQSLHQILQIVSLTQFEKIPIFSMFETKNYNFQNISCHN